MSQRGRGIGSSRAVPRDARSGLGLRSLWFAHLSFLFFPKDPGSAGPGCLMGLRPAPRDLGCAALGPGSVAGKAGARQTQTGLRSELRVRGTRLKAGRGRQKALPEEAGIQRVSGAG